MSANHHPDDATLLAYAAGTLDEAFALVTASHLAHCAGCRAKVRLAENLGGALLEDAGEAELTDDALGEAMRRISASAPLSAAPTLSVSSPQLPAPLGRLIGSSLEDVRWRRAAPGVRMHKVKLSAGARSALHLLRVEAGRRIPGHGHGGMELTLVLKGAYRDEFGRFGPGDIADHDAHVEHSPVAEPGEECICAVATEAPTRFRGLVSRMLQPFFGI